VKTFFLDLTPRQRDQIVKFKNQNGCTFMQPLALDGKKALLRCSSISSRELETINRALKGMKKSFPTKQSKMRAA
jgi:hypothetical protein